MIGKLWESIPKEIITSLELKTIDNIDYFIFSTHDKKEITLPLYRNINDYQNHHYDNISEFCKHKEEIKKYLLKEIDKLEWEVKKSLDIFIESKDDILFKNSTELEETINVLESKKWKAIFKPEEMSEEERNELQKLNEFKNTFSQQQHIQENEKKQELLFKTYQQQNSLSKRMEWRLESQDTLKSIRLGTNTSLQLLLWYPINDKSELIEQKKYYRSHIIDKIWLDDNISTIEKLYQLGLTYIHCDANPIGSLERLDDIEKEERMRDFYKPIMREEIENQEWQIIIKDDYIIVRNIRDELNNLIWERANTIRRFDNKQRYRNNERDKEEEENIKDKNIGHMFEIVDLIIQYHNNKLFIKTEDGNEMQFTWDNADKSIDNILYYLDHQEKSITNYIIDHYHWRDRSFVHHKDRSISDLSFGNLEETIKSLWEENIAPIFCLVLRELFLPELYDEE